MYTRLAQDEIRVALLRGSGNLIQVELKKVKWPPSTTSEPYEALSYVWGEPGQSMILVTTDTGSHRLYSITANLDAALHHFRRKGHDRYLWIDALCINQNDVEEKEQQVSMMDRIYQAAKKVCVWLGPESPESNRAMAVIPKILRSISDVHPAESLNDHDWDIFAHLLQRAWFSRRWVVQEIALAKAATVHCGHKTASWTDFSDAISLYVSEQASGWASSATDPATSGLGASTLSFLSENALRKDRQGKVLGRLWPMEDLLALLPMFQARVPHDTIYAILSVASDSAALPPVDYIKPHAALFTEVFKHIAESSHSLDMMFRPWAPETPGERLPSFIAPASRRTHIPGADGLNERRNADSLVGAPRRRIYTATPHPTTSPVLTESYDNARRHKNSATTLATRGVVCAIITEVASVCENGVIPRDWLDVWENEQSQHLRPDIWRVLVAGRSHDGTAAPNWYRRAFDNLVANSRNNKLGLNLPDMIRASPSSNMADFLRRVSTCVWGRRFLVSTRDRPGFFGLVPREATPGDMICLLEGCSVPVVLRGKLITEWVLQALQAAQPALLAPGGLTATMEEQMVKAFRDVLTWDLRVGRDVLSDLSLDVRSCAGDIMGRFGYSFSEYTWEDMEPRDELRVRAPLDARAKLMPFLSENEWMDNFRQLFKHDFANYFKPALTKLVAATLRGLSTRETDGIRELALPRFFRVLMDEILGHPANAVLLPAPPVQLQSPSWADTPVRELFQPLFARACEQAVEEQCRRETDRETDLKPGANSYHTNFVRGRYRAFQEVVEAVWPTAWKTVWAGSKHLTAELLSGDLGVNMWEKALQEEMGRWTRTPILTPEAYGVEVVGECYVQGLMDGEWWNADDTKDKEKRVFIIG